MDRMTLGEFPLDVVGARIRAIRQTRGMTVQQVAGAAGTSSAMISQVERGVTSPSLETLWRIANVLGVAMFQFFGDQPSSRVVVTRTHERLRLVWRESPVHYQLLSPAAGRELVMFILRLEPGESTLPRAHPGEEGGFVIRGQLAVTIDGTAYQLKQGDSIYFDSTAPHGFYNPGSEPMESVWAMTSSGLTHGMEIRR